MNPDPSKLRQQQEEQAEQVVDSRLEASAETGQEFDSVEEVIRFDADRNPPPESIAERLKESISREPPPKDPWWRRLFSR